MKNFRISYWLIFLSMLSIFLIGCQKSSGETSNQTSSPIPTPSVDKPNLPAPVPTPRTEPSNVLFVLDASGSMKQLIEGKSKMETAKEVLNNLVGTLSPDSRVGLMAYGHREKNNCQDTELVVPLDPLRIDLFRRKIQSLQPLGQTPISYSLRRAAEILQGRPGRQSVILISDGEETCHQDPCLVAAELKKAQIDFRVHVVGFKIDSARAKTQLTCIAEKTDGTYTDAGNADELKKRLENVAGGRPSPGNTGRLVIKSLDSKGNPFPWYIEFLKAGTQERVDANYTVGHPSADLPPGLYDLNFYKSNDITGITRKNVEIKAGEETRVEIERAGRLMVRVLDKNGQDIGNVHIKAHPTREDISWVIFSPNTPQEILPGVYNLEFWGGAWLERKGVEVKPGEETKIEINYGQ